MGKQQAMVSHFLAASITCLILLAGCGGGSGSSNNSGSMDSGAVYQPEFTEDGNGNVIRYSFKSDIQFDDENRFPKTLQFDFEFSKPVRRENNFLVTLEPATRITIKENPLLTERGSRYYRADIHVWNKTGDDYPGSFYEQDTLTGEIWYPNIVQSTLQYALRANNQNMSNGWFTWFSWGFNYPFSDILNPFTQEVEIQNSGVHFQPWRVAVRQYDDGSVFTGYGGVGFNLAADFAQGAQLDEVFDRSLLVEYSPWYSRISFDNQAIQCGSVYRFFEDGTISIEKDSNGALGKGTYQFDENGSIEWSTDAFGQKTMKIVSLNRQEWQFRDDSESSFERGTTNINGEAEVQSASNNWQCGFQLER